MKISAIILGVSLLMLFSKCKEKPNEQFTSEQNLPSSVHLDHDSIPYVTLPVDDLNLLIDSLGTNDLETLAKVYYLPKMMGEGNESYTIFPEGKKTPRRVTILHDNLPDDSQRGVKYTILIDDDFDVIEIRKSIRCWPGRGRGYWHGGKCS